MKKRILHHIEIDEVSGVDQAIYADLQGPVVPVDPDKRAALIAESEAAPPWRPTQESSPMGHLMYKSRDPDEFLDDVEVAELDRFEKQVDVLEKTLHSAIAANKRQDDDSTVTSFDKHVREIVQRDGIAPLLAMAKARKEYPSDFKRYQAATPEMQKAAAKRCSQCGAFLSADNSACDNCGASAKAPDKNAVQKFDEAVIALAKSRNMPRSAAMTEVRQREPQLFQAAYG